jgi:hypothetical protein
VYRYLREAVGLLAAMAPTLEQAIAVARRKAFVILDGTLLRIDRIGMTSAHNRAFDPGKQERHVLDVQVIADPAPGWCESHRRCRAPVTTWVPHTSTGSSRPSPKPGIDAIADTPTRVRV